MPQTAAEGPASRTKGEDSVEASAALELKRFGPPLRDPERHVQLIDNLHGSQGQSD